MDPLDLAERLSAVPRRGAGSDAERRAARLLVRELKDAGRREARTWTFWTRPSFAAVHTLALTCAVIGSVLAVDRPWLGFGLVAGGLAALLADLSGRVPILRRLTYERATQDVVARDPRTSAVRLVVCAPIDAPKAGVLDAGRLARALPSGRFGRYGLALAVLVVLLVLVSLRAAGIEGDWIGPAQLAPTVLALLVLGVLLDTATSRVPERGTGSAAACAVAVALVRELAERPPRGLAVDVVLHGAAGAHAAGMRRWVTAERQKGRRAENVAVLAIEPCAAGVVHAWASEGLVLALRAHPALLGHATAAGLPTTRSATWSGARAARAAGWPALRLGTVGPAAADDVELDPAALRATLDAAREVVARLDATLAPAPPPPPTAAPPVTSRPGSRHERRAAAAAARAARPS